jgi:hypothetical protein
MPFDEGRLEAYAMRAEEMSQALPPNEGGVEIDAVGQALGMTREEGRELATYLANLGWAKATFMSTPRLVLTPLGYREIRKLRWPRWRRWADRHGTLVIALAGLALGVLNLLMSLLGK